MKKIFSRLSLSSHYVFIIQHISYKFFLIFVFVFVFKKLLGIAFTVSLPLCKVGFSFKNKSNGYFAPVMCIALYRKALEVFVIVGTQKMAVLLMVHYR